MKGSTRKRGPSWTSYWFTVDPGTGKRKQFSKGGFRTQKEAQAHLVSVLPAVQAGTFKPDGKLTVSEVLAQWHAAKSSEGIRPGTVDMYLNVINGWLVPHVGGLKLVQLCPAVAAELMAKLRSEGSRLGRGALSDRSVQLAVTVLKTATRWAWEQGYTGRDVLAGYKRPKIAPSDRASSAWTPEEAGRFLAAVAEDRLRAAWWLLLTRGLRRGELLGLRWPDVDLGGGHLRIVRTRVVVDGQVIESDPKTKNSRRQVPRDPHLVTELRSHRRHQLEERLRAGEAWKESGFVFVDELGQPIVPDTLSGRFDTLIAHAGVRRVRLHDGRHSAANMLLEDGTPVHIVSAILGHSKPSITLDVYSHAVTRGGEVAGERLSALLAAQASRAGSDDPR